MAGCTSRTILAFTITIVIPVFTVFWFWKKKKFSVPKGFSDNILSNKDIGINSSETVFDAKYISHNSPVKIEEKNIQKSELHHFNLESEVLRHMVRSSTMQLKDNRQEQNAPTSSMNGSVDHMVVEHLSELQSNLKSGNGGISEKIGLENSLSKVCENGTSCQGGSHSEVKVNGVASVSPDSDTDNRMSDLASDLNTLHLSNESCLDNLDADRQNSCTLQKNCSLSSQQDVTSSHRPLDDEVAVQMEKTCCVSSLHCSSDNNVESTKETKKQEEMNELHNISKDSAEFETTCASVERTANKTSEELSSSKDDVNENNADILSCREVKTDNSLELEICTEVPQTEETSQQLKENVEVFQEKLEDDKSLLTAEAADSVIQSPVSLFDSSNPCIPEDESSSYPLVSSDVRSEGSTDSGKGGSELQFGADNNHPLSTDDAIVVYEFELPQLLCGRLIGRQGKHVNFIKNQTNANIFIKRHPLTPQLKLCAIEGTQAEIKGALELIQKKFPLELFPSVTLVQVNAPVTCGFHVPDTLQLHLPEGVTCDVILSSMVTAGHFFLQQPTHPTYPSLSRLDQCMLACYTQMDTPRLPQPVEPDVICAANIMGGWYRAQVVYVHESMEDGDVKYVDYGGYSRLSLSSLRQIRSDFMTLPFQASECYLGNVKPINEETGWSLEASAVFEDLAHGQILQAIIVGYAEGGIPYVHLYRIQGVSTVFINRELVNQGLAEWVEIKNC